MDTVRVWIDDPNPIFRLGLACCLRRPRFTVVGQSARFVPAPDLERLDVLVFDVGEQSLAWTLGYDHRRAVRLVGLVTGTGPELELLSGRCTVLVRSELTPEGFIDCLESMAAAERRPAPPRPLPAARAGLLRRRPRRDAVR
jgi:hypothetical protein